MMYCTALWTSLILCCWWATDWLASAETYQFHLPSSKPSPSEYWKAFLNVSYMDPKLRVWRTAREETGRYSHGNTDDVTGIAVEIVSYDPFSNSSSIEEGGDVTNSTLVTSYADDVDIDDDDDNAVERLTGCDPPFVANYPTNGEKWIAVIRRGKCTFNQKIQNALKLNASGVLIYDNEREGKVLQAMVVEPYPIPSVFTYNWKGREIVGLVRKRERVVLRMHKGSRCRTAATFEDVSVSMYSCIPLDEWEDFQNMLLKKHGSSFWNWNITGMKSTVYSVEKRTSVLFVSVSFMILMLISLAWLVFYYIQRFRYIHAKDQMERKLCSQAKRALAIISTSVLKKDDLDKKDFADTCAVCIENYRVADVVRVLPCKHQFHKSCIDQWLLEKRTCPMCKMDILKHYGLITEEQPSTSEESGSANFA